MTYAQKLKDPRWMQFRELAFHHHGRQCQQCGQDKLRHLSLHVHHKRYFNGRDPWEYDMEDVMVICGDCHEIIHDAENAWRDIIRSLPPWCAVEWRDAATCFSELRFDPARMNTVGAKVRGIMRQIHYGERRQSENQNLEA